MGGETEVYALNGRVNGNAIVVNENITRYEGCDVVITILDRIAERDLRHTHERDNMEASARALAGLWKTHNNDLSVEEAVRAMRRGRQFDT